MTTALQQAATKRTKGAELTEHMWREEEREGRSQGKGMARRHSSGERRATFSIVWAPCHHPVRPAPISPNKQVRALDTVRDRSYVIIVKRRAQHSFLRAPTREAEQSRKSESKPHAAALPISSACAVPVRALVALRSDARMRACPFALWTLSCLWRRRPLACR